MILLHVRFRKFVRTRPDEVSLSDLASIQKVYSPGTSFRKSTWYSVWGNEEVRPLNERDEGVHGKAKGAVNLAFCSTKLALAWPLTMWPAPPASSKPNPKLLATSMLWS